MKLLIVDDEPEILNMLRRNLELEGYTVSVTTSSHDALEMMKKELFNLELEGYTVSVTTSSHDALEMMKKELFNLVITDVKMPGMGGVELLQEVKRINPLANVIIMTGYSTMSNVVECLGSGAVDYFVKPFKDIDVLITALEQARGRVERWREAMGVKP